jgi:hypothetical protein
MGNRSHAGLDEGRHPDERPVAKRTRKVRLQLGLFRLYIDDEFEELAREGEDLGNSGRRRGLRALPLGLIIWATDVASIFVHLAY